MSPPGAAGPEAPPAPFSWRHGRLFVEDVDLSTLPEGLEGRPAWVLSDAAIRTAIVAAGGNGPRTVELASAGPREVLRILAGAGWWVRVSSSHELRVASAAGFPSERVIGAGVVRDDGFLKDALGAGVGVLEHEGDGERSNAERVAQLLGHELPPDQGAPADAPLGLFDRVGGLLAAVLRGPPALALDAAWTRPLDDEGAPLEVCALEAGDLEEGHLQGLAGSGAPRRAWIFGALRRGQWAVVACAAAARGQPPSRRHPLPETVLVRGALWRVLEVDGLPDVGV